MFFQLYSPMARGIATQWYYAAHSDIPCGSFMRIKYHYANGIISLLRLQKYHAEGNSAYHSSFSPHLKFLESNKIIG